MKDSFRDGAEIRTAHIELSVSGKRLALDVAAPAAITTPEELLPLFQSLADAFVGLATETAESSGECISCRKGCAACCRQLVPISEAGARRLQALVAELPEEKRARVLARVKANRERLADAGLLDRLEKPEGITDEELIPIGLHYNALWLDCPFLENESCSIHPARPIACREFLVTSPAENCSHPTKETVRSVKMPLKASTALARLNEKHTLKWIPLTLAVDWPEERFSKFQPQPGTQIVSEFFRQLTGKSVAAPSPE